MVFVQRARGWPANCRGSLRGVADPPSEQVNELALEGHVLLLHSRLLVLTRGENGLLRQLPPSRKPHLAPTVKDMTPDLAPDRLFAFLGDLTKKENCLMSPYEPSPVDAQSGNPRPRYAAAPPPDSSTLDDVAPDTTNTTSIPNTPEPLT